jgi:sialate O-acetylesterase
MLLLSIMIVFHVANMAAGSPSIPLNFSHLYSDSMILQRSPHPASIWGWGSPGSQIAVSIKSSRNGTTVSSDATASTVGPNGAWRVSLPPQSASKIPVAIVATSSTGESVQIKDVLFGDVFVCSG